MAGSQRVAVVTGASSGIGKAAAAALAAQGWRVLATGRDAGRCATAEAELQAGADKAGAEGSVEMLRADLSLLSEAERLADEIVARTDRLDVLLNNAGGMASAQVMTNEGHEANYAANFLGPMVLTEKLLPLLRKTAEGQPAGAVRIVNTSSDGSEMIPGINLADLENLGNWNPGAAYCSGKLANVLHAKVLSGRLADAGIVAHSMHPGTVDSNFFSHTPQSVQDAYGDAPKLTNEDGADTLVWLATAEEPGQSSGLYWHKRAERTPNPVVEDAAFVDAFWKAAQELAAR